jgi:hypothetical protein
VLVYARASPAACQGLQGQGKAGAGIAATQLVSRWLPLAWAMNTRISALSQGQLSLGPRATRPSMAVYDKQRVVLDRHGRQILDLLLGEVEPDSGLDPGDRPDRDGHFLASPLVPLLQEHVGHVMVIGVDDKAFNPPDVPVRGMNVLTAAYLHFA